MSSGPPRKPNDEENAPSNRKNSSIRRNVSDDDKKEEPNNLCYPFGRSESIDPTIGMSSIDNNPNFGWMHFIDYVPEAMDNYTPSRYSSRGISIGNNNNNNNNSSIRFRDVEPYGTGTDANSSRNNNNTVEDRKGKGKAHVTYDDEIPPFFPGQIDINKLPIDFEVEDIASGSNTSINGRFNLLPDLNERIIDDDEFHGEPTVKENNNNVVNGHNPEPAAPPKPCGMGEVVIGLTAEIQYNRKGRRKTNNHLQSSSKDGSGSSSDVSGVLGKRRNNGASSSLSRKNNNNNNNNTGNSQIPKGKRSKRPSSSSVVEVPSDDEGKIMMNRTLQQERAKDVRDIDINSIPTDDEKPDEAAPGGNDGAETRSPRPGNVRMYETKGSYGQPMRIFGSSSLLNNLQRLSVPSKARTRLNGSNPRSNIHNPNDPFLKPQSWGHFQCDPDAPFRLWPPPGMSSRMPFGITNPSRLSTILNNATGKNAATGLNAATSKNRATGQNAAAAAAAATRKNRATGQNAAAAAAARKNRAAGQNAAAAAAAMLNAAAAAAMQNADATGQNAAAAATTRAPRQARRPPMAPPLDKGKGIATSSSNPVSDNNPSEAERMMSCELNQNPSEFNDLEMVARYTNGRKELKPKKTSRDKSPPPKGGDGNGKKKDKSDK